MGLAVANLTDLAAHESAHPRREVMAIVLALHLDVATMETRFEVGGHAVARRREEMITGDARLLQIGFGSAMQEAAGLTVTEQGPGVR